MIYSVNKAYLNVFEVKYRFYYSTRVSSTVVSLLKSQGLFFYAVQRLRSVPVPERVFAFYCHLNIVMLMI
ncbi:hypothetical protein D3P08_15975 [Paenibacillus nanensis]|uniref:Uncharacterized protein n=1 Tax=Paenibacillus nanensis TaxID=393251 RepID=A0A3A1USF0_9BACL|nr:hypothetical protein D3P08_15975 [Paenibacillus nanensis]